MTIERLTTYYIDETDSYLRGPLQGTCHFGYTRDDEHFELRTALHNMEVLLGETLNLPKGSVAVDAGCGYGRVAKTMASEYGLNVIGVDLISQRVEEAHRYVQEQGFANKVAIIQGDYTRLPLSDNSVDAVYTMETLCHADPLETAQSEFMRVLKPGGKVVYFEYTVPPFDSMNPVFRKIANSMSQRIGMTSISRFIHGSFPVLLEDAGFENIDVRDISRYVHPTWYWLFQKAIREKVPTILPKLLSGRLVRENTNVAGSLFIWPYRHHLRYVVASATKPDSHS